MAARPPEALRRILDRLGETWTVPIIRAVAEHPRHHRELCRLLGASSRMLTRALRRLEAEKLVSRLESERRVEYIATCFGLELCQLVKKMEDLALSQPPLPPQDSSPVCSFASNRLAHISIVTRDIEAAARSLAVILGGPVPSVLDLPVTALNERKAHIRVCRFLTANLDIELIQHRAGSSPFRDFVEQHGPGIDHIAFEVRQNFSATIRRLELLGGRRTIGGLKGEGFEDVDFRGVLGVTMELLSGPSAELAGSSRAAGSVRVTHLRVLVGDIRRTSAKYAEVFQMRRPAARMVTVSSRAPRARNRTAHRIKMAEFTVQGITIGLIEPVDGPALWLDRVATRGNGIYHLGLEVSRRPAGIVRALRSLGGTPVDLEFGGTRAFVDLTPQLGLVVEIASAARQRSRAARQTARRR